MAIVRHLDLFPKPCLNLGAVPENYLAKNISLLAAMNLVWRVQKFRVNFTGRIKTLFRAFDCDNESTVERFVTHEINTSFFLYLNGSQNKTEKDIVCGDNIVYSGQEAGDEPRSSAGLVIRTDTLPIHKSGETYSIPLFLIASFLPLDRQQKSNLEYVTLEVNSANREQLILPFPQGSGWKPDFLTLNVLSDEYSIHFAFISDDPESDPPPPITCIDPESGPFQNQFFAQVISQEIDNFTLTPFYWPYDPEDGLGPIYDNITGEQLREFPST